ncbi:hypothetical protein SAMN05421647_1141 [Marinobacterium stanieri]|uniref:Uncharacterized protein n=1 Tax=Marinobacterium stanieri TaxID=49186 RepID=A0A1N6XFW5_9GAMM|nr:hypothetical protein SAMN05421647_1141 [Marinobacterium stanieri]
MIYLCIASKKIYCIKGCTSRVNQKLNEVITSKIEILNINQVINKSILCISYIIENDIVPILEVANF